LVNIFKLEVKRMIDKLEDLKPILRELVKEEKIILVVSLKEVLDHIESEFAFPK
jgi:hypothetical protein